jgi:CRP-like cAMP-binding protein
MRKVLFILGQLNDADVDWLVENGQKEQLPTGKTLIREGEPITALYITLDGLLSVTDVELDGQELARLGAGELVGEMSFIDTSPPASTVTALQPSTVLAIPKVRLQAKLERDMAFAARFYKALAIFLSSRLRSLVTNMGDGDGPIKGLNERTHYADELDEAVLDNIHLAGDRFERMLKYLNGR